MDGSEDTEADGLGWAAGQGSDDRKDSSGHECRTDPWSSSEDRDGDRGLEDGHEDCDQNTVWQQHLVDEAFCWGDPRPIRHIAIELVAMPHHV